MVMRAIFSALASLTVVASSASAQQSQTPESAQKFIALHFPLEMEYVTSSGHVIKYLLRARPTYDPRVICNTTIDAPSERNDGSSFKYIHWPWISGVSRNEGSAIVILETNSADYFYRLRFGSAALAARASFAMEFLRQHCDPAADTGF
jgi:hypothetical protein